MVFSDITFATPNEFYITEYFDRHISSVNIAEILVLQLSNKSQVLLGTKDVLVKSVCNLTIVTVGLS